MFIKRFTAENVKKLKVVEITPDGNVVVLGGANASGKSSVLDSIMCALGGKKYVQEKMLREGEKKGFVELDLGDIKVKRTFTDSGGGTLVVSNKDGAKYSSPQAMLDSLVGRISFDPLEFTRLDTKKQVEVLKEVTGVSFDELNKKKEEAYNQRTELNRQLKTIQTEAESLKTSLPTVLPSKKFSISELMEQFDGAQKTNSFNNKVRYSVKSIKDEINRESNKLNLAMTQLEELQANIKTMSEHIEHLTTEQQAKEKEVANLKDVDIEPIQELIKNAEANNNAFDKGERLSQLRKQYTEVQNKVKSCTKIIDDSEEEKQKLIKTSKLPIDGLTFDENGVSYNGLPFNQASSAEQLRVSTALAIQMNANLKVLLVKDGSLLDSNNLKMIAEMAEKSDSQVWIERVSEGKEVSVILEDGVIKDVGI